MTIQYISWDGTKWAARIEGTDFVHAPTGDWSRSHRDVIINYITWDGTRWSAKIEDLTFVHAPAGDWSRSHRDVILNYRGWNGEKKTMRLGEGFGQTPPTVDKSLTGAWVHSMDPKLLTPNSRVIVIQEGSQVTMVRAEKYRGKWIVSRCVGTLSSKVLRANCDYSPGGNPFGFAATVESWKVSADGNRLDGIIEGGHESHYSRIP
jgi:hypothetical protein